MELINRESTQADRTGKFKDIMTSFAKNLIYYLCLMAPVAVVGVVWFDMKPELAWRMVYGGIPLVIVFVMAERAMMDIGRDAGKVDRDLINTREIFRDLRKRAVEIGTTDMKQFVVEEIDTELEEARRAACRKLKLDYDVYLAECAGKTKNELKRKFGSRTRAAKVYAINLIRPIVLTVDMILSDTPTDRSRGGIGKTAEEYLDGKKGLKGTLWAIISVFLITGIAISPARAFSWEIVVYTIWALMLLFYRMARGYKNGVMAYASVQVRNYEDRTRYLEKYLEWMRVKGEGEKGRSDYILTTEMA